MRGNPRMGAGWAKVGLLAGIWLASGAGLGWAEDAPLLPPSIWARTLPAESQPAATTPPAPMPPITVHTAPMPASPASPPAATPAKPVPASQNPPAPAASCPECCPPKKSLWDNVPPVKPMPPLGNFATRPTGCGYYTGLDFILDDLRPGPPNYPYPPFGAMAGSFFDADYRYLDKPDNQQHDFFDFMKRVHVGDDWMFTSGGEFRTRLMNEVDSRLTAHDNNYDLLRTRVYGDLWYRDLFRVYAEFLYADSFYQDLTPLGIDINRSDLLNLFVDLKVGEIDGRPVYVRGGRQELLYGSERLISPLDWANTRRTFQGVKAFYQGDKLDVDAFWVQPVEAVRNDFDSVDHRLNFTGVWATYRPEKGRYLDFYVLNLDRSGASGSTQAQVPGAVNTLAPNHFNITTMGTRDTGTYCDRVTWDFESMLQVGDYGRDPLFAYAYTTGLGYRFADVPWTPHVWLYYDYASGDAGADRDGNFNTFNQLFPFGHYYLGYNDLV
ncbi:MAG TPA: alginate export family protein, partial [Gemmataceae bacterium]|nr:alginate export family protein [Gemmataceae bacterium]